jgi:hypothetical protein
MVVFSLFASLVFPLAQSCQHDSSRSSNKDDATFDDESTIQFTDGEVALDGDLESKDASVLTSDATGDVIRVDSAEAKDANNLDSSSDVTSDRIVTPDDVTLSLLSDFVNEPTNWNDLPSLEPDSCGYSMNIEHQNTFSSNDETVFKEVRLFDEGGNLLVQQGACDFPNCAEKTEILYDEQKRPISMWIKALNNMTATGGINVNAYDAAITAIKYNDDGSALSKSVHQRDSDFIFQYKPDCDYLVFDSSLRFIEIVRDSDCDNNAEEQIDMAYYKENKPQRYQKRQVFTDTPGYNSESEVTWSYTDNDREVTASWNDSYYGESLMYFSFDAQGKLVSIRVDYKSDGTIDETTEYNYDKQGNMTRTATDLDQDGIVDLLRINTYDQSGHILTHELHNVMSPEKPAAISDNEFANVAVATAQITTYIYDSSSKLTESTTKDSSAKGEYQTEHRTYGYDNSGRLIEEKVERTSYAETESGEKEISDSDTTTCTFDYPCNNRFDETSELRLCKLDASVTQYLFPYNAIRQIPFQQNRYSVDPGTLTGIAIYIKIDPEDVLGIPWY